MTAAARTCHSSSYEATDRCTSSSGHSTAIGQTRGRATPPRQGDRLFATHCCRRRFPQRATGLHRNLTLAGTAEQSRDGECGRSQRPADGLDGFGVGRLHPTVTNWCCRPSAADDRDGVGVGDAEESGRPPWGRFGEPEPQDRVPVSGRSRGPAIVKCCGTPARRTQTRVDPPRPEGRCPTTINKSGHSQVGSTPTIGA